MIGPVANKQFQSRATLQFVFCGAGTADQTKLKSSHLQEHLFMSCFQSGHKLYSFRFDFKQSWSDVLALMLHNQFPDLGAKKALILTPVSSFITKGSSPLLTLTCCRRTRDPFASPPVIASFASLVDIGNMASAMDLSAHDL